MGMGEFLEAATYALNLGGETPTMNEMSKCYQVIREKGKRVSDVDNALQLLYISDAKSTQY